MHLTNYAIQKRSEDFIRDEDAGTKRRISTINKWLVENGYDIEKMWTEIDDVIIKVLISAHPVLKHNYRSCFPNHYRGSACFEILGFDILLDRKLKPIVLEVRRNETKRVEFHCVLGQSFAEFHHRFQIGSRHQRCIDLRYIITFKFTFS